MEEIVTQIRAALLTTLLLCAASHHVAAAFSPAAAAREDTSVRQLGESLSPEYEGIPKLSEVRLATSDTGKDALTVKTLDNPPAQMDDVQFSVYSGQSAVDSDLRSTKAELVQLEAGFEEMKEELRSLRIMYQEELNAYKSQVDTLISRVNSLEEKVQNNSQVTNGTKRGSSLITCNGTKVVHETSGSLAVVDSGHYSENMECGWQVELPAGSQTLLRWIYFEVETEEACKYDYVTVEDMTRSNQLLYGKKLCGSSRPDGMVVDSHKLNITFHSDDSKNFRGFWLYFQAMPED